MTDRTHWVEVSETYVYQYGTGAEWWAIFRHVFNRRTDRIRTIRPGVIGDTVLVACTDREHAEWLRRHMLSRGMPRTAATVRSYRAGSEPPAVGLSDDDLAANLAALDVEAADA